MRARVIAVGEAAAGDDGVGPAVLARLRDEGLPDGVETLLARDPMDLVGAIDGAARVVVVDALVGIPPGEVREMAPEEVAAGGPAAVSTHGMGVREAIELARAVRDAPLPPIRIVAVGIERPAALGMGLSPAVAAAVARAAARVRALVGGGG
jgi:hydrogenase maturation protease